MHARRWLIVLVVGLALATAGCAGEQASQGPGDVGDDGAGDDAAPEEPDSGDDGDGPAAGDGDEPPSAPPNVTLAEVASGLEGPTLLTSAGDGTGRLFVLEQPGRVRVLQNGSLREEPYLDVTDRTRAEGERGLLGLAFAPDFAANGHLYVSYTDENGTSTLVRSTVDDPTSGQPSGEPTTLLTVEQPYGNHNGGHVAFGPDGYLYYGLGDGGSGGDPDGNGQDPTTLLGSLLRLEVSGEQPQAPADNPFVGTDEGHDLVWAYGLRNPWRFSFDRGTGDLFVGDVGQDGWEEIDRQPAGSEGGENYGWNRWEANHTYQGDPSREGYTFPILEYAREEERCSVTGGYVYRGEAIPELEGFYVYGDFCSGEIWAAHDASDGWRSQTLLDTELRISSFGEDADGEVYVLGRDGGAFRLVPG